MCLGTGGTTYAFVTYMLFNIVYTSRLAAWDHQCGSALPSYRVHFDGLFYTQMSVAFAFLLLSIYYVNLGRRLIDTEI